MAGTAWHVMRAHLTAAAAPARPAASRPVRHWSGSSPPRKPPTLPAPTAATQIGWGVGVGIRFARHELREVKLGTDTCTSDTCTSDTCTSDTCTSDTCTSDTCTSAHQSSRLAAAAAVAVAAAAGGLCALSASALTDHSSVATARPNAVSRELSAQDASTRAAWASGSAASLSVRLATTQWLPRELALLLLLLMQGAAVVSASARGAARQGVGAGEPGG